MDLRTLSGPQFYKAIMGEKYPVETKSIRFGKKSVKRKYELLPLFWPNLESTHYFVTKIKLL